MIKKNKTIEGVAEAFIKKAIKLGIPVPEDIVDIRYPDMNEEK